METFPYGLTRLAWKTDVKQTLCDFAGFLLKINCTLFVIHPFDALALDWMTGRQAACKKYCNINLKSSSVEHTGA